MSIVQRVVPGFEVFLIARVESVKRATAVSSRAAEMEVQPAPSGQGPTQSPPFGGSYCNASEEAFEWFGSFKTWKLHIRGWSPPKFFKAATAATPYVQTANTIRLVLFWGVFCISVLTWVKYYRSKTAIPCWGSENRVHKSVRAYMVTISCFY